MLLGTLRRKRYLGSVVLLAMELLVTRIAAKEIVQDSLLKDIDRCHMAALCC